MSLFWKSKAIKSFWKTIFPLLIRLNVYWPCNPGILLLDKYDKWKHMPVERLVHDSHIAGASQVVLVGKNSPANEGDIRDAGWIPGLGRSPWRRAWQPTPVFLPGESHGQRSLVGSKGSQRVGHTWNDWVHAYIANLLIIAKNWNLKVVNRF